MSPFLFLLVVEGLSGMVTASKREGTIMALISGIIFLCPIYYL